MSSFVNAAVAGVLAAVATAAFNPAHAGTCLPGQLREGVRTSGETVLKGETDTVLAAIDLAKEPVAADGQLRLRRIVVQPGGVVPWHSHANRPAIIHVVKGEIIEYASNCAVGITHKAGETVAEKAPISHWWKNDSAGVVELLSADYLPGAAGKR